MRSKLLSITVALLASVCLWLYVVNVVNPEDTPSIYGVPVTFYGEEELRANSGLIITSGSNQTVNLKVSGKRMVVQNLSAENMSVRVDVSRIKKADTYENRSYEIVLPPEVAKSDVSVVDRSPGLISFTVEKLASKTLEVKGVPEGEVAEGYVAEALSFDTDQIKIEGPEALINQISYAQVIFSRADLDRTVTTAVPYTLVDKDGSPVDNAEITADVDEIKVTQAVVKLKEIPLKVDFLPGGGATEADVVCEISPQTITVSGDAAVLDSLNQIVLGNVDLGDINAVATLSMPITLPDGLKNVSGEEKAEVAIKISGLETKAIRVSAFDFINIPDGFTPDPVTQMLQLTVRAPASEIGKISAASLKVTADLAEYPKEGMHSIPVKITVEGFEKAGVMGDYTVVVSLKKD